MSTCISRHGEFSEHSLDDSYTCTLCHVLDEEALRVELERLRAALAAVEQDRDRLRAELDDANQTRAEVLAATCWDDGEDREEVPAEEIRDIFERADRRLEQRMDQGMAVGAERDQPLAADEPDLIIYQAWDTDEIGWSDDNGMSGTDVEAVKLAALESFVAWSIEENWCGDPEEVERFEAELREGLHWRQIGKAWELHRGTQPEQGNSTWQGITIFTMKVSRDTVADVEAKCSKARAEHGGEADRRG